MTRVQPYEMAPAVLVSGSPKEAARFLVSLCREQVNPVPARQVLNWLALLHVRGADFDSHVVTCHYWLHEHCHGHMPGQSGADCRRGACAPIRDCTGQ